MILDILYNLVVLAADGLVLVRVRRQPRGGAAVAVVAAGGFGAAFLGGLMGGGFFGILRCWAWTIFLHGPLVLAAVGWMLRGTSKATSWTAFALAALTAAVGVDAFFLEPYRLELTRVRVESPKLRRPLRIGILADLQTDKVGEHEERAVRMLMAEKPDLILLPGDFVQSENHRIREEVTALFRREKLSAPLGVYAVQGDVDTRGWTDIFAGLPATAWERTSTVELDGLRLTGLSFQDGADAGLAVAGAGLFHVVFAHRPDFALGDVRADLLVAGHTHGGQVRLPGVGPLVTMSRIPRAWAAGVTRLEGGRTLVVSRGVGMERGSAPRLRFRCRPELVFVDLVPSAAAELIK